MTLPFEKGQKTVTERRQRPYKGGQEVKRKGRLGGEELLSACSLDHATNGRGKSAGKVESRVKEKKSLGASRRCRKPFGRSHGVTLPRAQ